MKKFYIEVNNIADGGYILQSQWFDNIDDAEKFVKMIDYVDSAFSVDIMTAEWDGNGYLDIEIYKSVR